MALPQLDGRLMVTDGGMETDLIFTRVCATCHSGRGPAG